MKIFLQFAILCLFGQGIFAQSVLEEARQLTHEKAYVEASQLLETELKEVDTEELDVEQLEIYILLGQLYRLQGDFAKSQLYIERITTQHRVLQKNYIIQVARAYYERGILEESLGRLLEAEKYLRKSDGYFQAAQFEESTILLAEYARFLQFWAGVLDRLDSKEIALEKLLLVSKFYEENALNDSLLLAEQNLFLGRIYKGSQEAAQEAMYIDRALELKEAVEDKDLDWSPFMMQLVDYFLKLKKHDRALRHNEEHFDLLFLTEIDKTKQVGLKELEQTLSSGILVEVLVQRATIYTDQGDLKQALNMYLLLDEYLGALRQNYTDEQTRLLWSDKASRFYKKAIAIAWELDDQEKSMTYKEIAFRLSERSKSMLLLEAFKKTKAQKIAGIPDKLLQKEQALKQKMNDTQHQLDVLRSRKNRKKLETAFAKAKQEYELFITQLEKDYPKYYRLKYDLEVITVAKMQEILEKDQLLVEYFITDTDLFVFKINKQNFDFIKIPIELDLMQSILDFRKSIYSYFEIKDTGKRAELQKMYELEGLRLYQQLLAPVLTGDCEERVTIILAGALGFIPFEALLTENVVEGDNYNTYDYLIKKSILSYCYSATLLYEMEIKEHIPEKIFLGFSPNFDENKKVNNFNFSGLTYNEVEVNEIQNTLGLGEVFSGEVATKSNFQENCGEYCIVHIATHGVTNNRNSNLSFLAFAEVKDSINNEFLYVRDLYNMKMTANLVVLSACETGLGELYESEGIASLARGFAYAGAKAIVTSLWNVNDQATSQLMSSFYKQMKTGCSKDRALWQAKLNFINSNKDIAAHPFMWSPFIVVGDTEAVPSLVPDDYTWLFIVGGGLLLLGILFWFWRKTKFTVNTAFLILPL